MTTVKVSQREIEQRFEASRKDFQPEMAAIRWIVVESEETGRTVIERLQQGEAFGQLAKTVSIEPVSAKKGGAVGAVRPDKIPAELSVVVFAKDAKTGLVSRPIEVIKAIPFYGPPGWYVAAIDELVRQGDHLRTGGPWSRPWCGRRRPSRRWRTIWRGGERKRRSGSRRIWRLWWSRSPNPLRHPKHCLTRLPEAMKRRDRGGGNFGIGRAEPGGLG
jgi:hypothetical protein